MNKKPINKELENMVEKSVTGKGSQAEQALEMNKEIFRKILESLPFGITIMAADQTFEYANPKFREMTGYTLEDIPNKMVWMEKAYPDEKYRKYVFDVFKKDMINNPEAGERQEKDFIVRCKNGRDKVILFRAVALKSGRQMLTYQDITSKRETEEALRKSGRKYRILFEKSKDAILIIRNKQFVDCNQSAVDLLGYRTRNDIIQTHPSRLSPEKQPDGRPSFEKAEQMMEMAIEKGSHRFEWQHLKANGDIVPLDILLTTISFEKDNQEIHTIWRDITELKKEEEKLSRLANTDMLTGVYNRRAFIDYLYKNMARARRSSEKLSLLMLDIDHFKKVNDTHGHDAGDQVLKDLVQFVMDNIRQQDILARWGGEEFVLLLPNTGKNVAVQLAERLRKGIAEHGFTIFQKVTVSMGAAEFKEDDTQDSFVKRSDQALYKAKQDGRNRVES